MLAQPLQTVATEASVAVMKLTGLWAIAEGNLIYLGSRPLEVAEACNGLSMMMSLMAVVVATLLLVPLSNWMRGLLFLSAAPVALASNVIRIVATAWCVHRLGVESGGRFAHDLAGWLMMPLALLLVGPGAGPPALALRGGSDAARADAPGQPDLPQEAGRRHPRHGPGREPGPAERPRSVAPGPSRRRPPG